MVGDAWSPEVFRSGLQCRDGLILQVPMVCAHCCHVVRHPQNKGGQRVHPSAQEIELRPSSSVSGEDDLPWGQLSVASTTSEFGEGCFERKSVLVPCFIQIFDPPENLMQSQWSIPRLFEKAQKRGDTSQVEWWYLVFGNIGINFISLLHQRLNYRKV